MDYHVSTTWFIIIIVLLVWELIWKALALWQAAQRKQLYWFSAILVLNTAGILPIIYLFTHPAEKA